MNDIHKHPFEGIRKPEALKYQYKGYWSRRITEEHRLVYEVLPGRDINIISVQGHSPFFARTKINSDANVSDSSKIISFIKMLFARPILLLVIKNPVGHSG